MRGRRMCRQRRRLFFDGNAASAWEEEPCNREDQVDFARVAASGRRAGVQKRKMTEKEK